MIITHDGKPIAAVNQRTISFDAIKSIVSELEGELN